MWRLGPSPGMAVTLVERYCSATNIGTRPRPSASGASALPMTAPKARAGSATRIAWPGVSEVVSRSPG